MRFCGRRCQTASTKENVRKKHSFEISSATIRRLLCQSFHRRQRSLEVALNLSIEVGVIYRNPVAVVKRAAVRAKEISLPIWEEIDLLILASKAALMF